MHKQSVTVAALFAATSLLSAQEPSGRPPEKSAAQAEQAAMPDPKQPEHEALRTLAGTWHSKVRMAAMPGVPGMEKPSEAEGIEHAELVCGGLWLQWTSEGEFNGQPFQGLWLAGYDPFEKQYVSVWADSNEAKPTEITGTYDAAKNRWEWRGTGEFGAMRSEIVWQDADTMVETSWLTPPGGDEVQTMQATRTRSKAKSATTAVTEATLRDVAKDSPALAALHADIGTWQATVRSTVDPAAPPTEEKGRERVTPICGGKYTWSNFSGSMMGAPFEGHALVGYDPTEQEFVCYWIDSMSPTWARTTGKFEPDADSLTMTGRCRCPDGRMMRMTEVMTREGENSRSRRMEFEVEGEPGKHVMEIDYVRDGDAKR